jgi:hypothetical protein
LTKRIAVYASLCLAAALPARAGTPLENLQQQAAHTAPKTAPAASVMLQAFQDFCLHRFPDQAAVKKAIAGQHLTPATKGERDQVTLGMSGDAWTLTVPKGTLVLTMSPPPQQGCSIAGLVQASSDINSNFDKTVTAFASSHTLGTVVRVQPHYGHVAGKTATAQLLNVAPPGAARQAFVNLDVLNPDTTTLVRMTRTIATGASGK